MSRLFTDDPGDAKSVSVIVEATIEGKRSSRVLDEDAYHHAMDVYYRSVAAYETAYQQYQVAQQIYEQSKATRLQQSMREGSSFLEAKFSASFFSGVAPKPPSEPTQPIRSHYMCVDNEPVSGDVRSCWIRGLYEVGEIQRLGVSATLGNSFRNVIRFLDEVYPALVTDRNFPRLSPASIEFSQEEFLLCNWLRIVEVLPAYLENEYSIVEARIEAMAVEEWRDGYLLSGKALADSAVEILAGKVLSLFDETQELAASI